MTRHPFDNGELMIRDEKLAAHPRDPDEIRQHLTEYHAMIDQLDEAIGWVIASHEARGMLDDTIIVFSGDNGLAVGQHGLMGKQSCYDHSLRVPMVLAGPGIPQGERRQQLCYLHDIFPTLCDLLGSSIPDSVTSRSFADRIRTDSPHRPELFAGYRDATRSLTRDDGWKLIVTTAGDGSVRTQLFHLPKDPWEQHDRSADTSCREILDSLQTALLQHSRQQQDTWAHRALVDRAQVATGS
jgi:arylsulfatase A-like enzyme